MNPQENLKKSSFDLYGRHKITQSILEKYSKYVKKDSLKVLDAGGAFNLLQKFIPNDSVYVIDPNIEKSEPERNIYKASATNMKDIFKDGEFDAVTSHDVFEHIYPQERVAFIEELLRVTKDLVILTAPFDTPKVSESEKTINKFYKKIHNAEHPWLIEHIENGIPEEKILIDYFKEKKIDYIEIHNNQIDTWLLCQYTILTLDLGDSDSRLRLIDKFNQYYNENIFPNDYSPESYRKIFIFSKNGIPEEVRSFIGTLKSKEINKEDLLKECFETIAESVQAKDNLIHQLVIASSKDNEYIKDYENNRIAELEKIIEKKDYDYGVLAGMVASSKTLKITRTLKRVKKLAKPSNLKRFSEFSTRLQGLIKRKLGKGSTEVDRSARFNLQTHSYEKDQHNYEIWLRKNYQSAFDLFLMKNEINSFEYLPKISIITPVYNVDEKWLRLAIESVMNQIYQNWELCLVDDASTKPHVRTILEEYARRDSRIKVKFSDKNQHISLTSNEAIAMSTGEFVGFLDNDDELTPNALFEVVKVLNQKELDFIYSDEDKITEDGKLTEPEFKPDWSPETTLSMMYTTHFSVYRKSLVEKVGGLRKGFEGSQDYDLVLRLTEHTTPYRIHHIPKILYHWRIIPTSTASSAGSKPYAYVVAKKALEETLQRRHIEGEVLDGNTINSFRIKRKIEGNPKINIIIPTKNRHDLVKVCIDSIIEKSTYKNYEIVLVDNNSDDPESIKYFESISNKVTLLKYPYPFNFSAINNFAVNKTKGEQILFLNNDTEVIAPEWLEALLEYSQLPEIGAVGAKLLYPNNTIQHAGVYTGIGGVAGHGHKNFDRDDFGRMCRIQVVSNVIGVTGACLMVKRKLFEEVGGFNEGELAVAFNDVDLCLKLHDKGYRNIYTPFAQLYHYESISRGHEDTPEKKARFQKESDYMFSTWGEYIKNDPYYNPHFSRTHEDFTFNTK